MLNSLWLRWQQYLQGQDLRALDSQPPYDLAMLSSLWVWWMKDLQGQDLRNLAFINKEATMVTNKGRD